MNMPGGGLIAPEERDVYSPTIRNLLRAGGAKQQNSSWAINMLLLRSEGEGEGEASK